MAFVRRERAYSEGHNMRYGMALVGVCAFIQCPTAIATPLPSKVAVANYASSLPSNEDRPGSMTLRQGKEQVALKRVPN
jgi:hypothetical protein